MFCISTHELYPVAIKFSNRNIASYSLLVGMGMCWAILEAVDVYFGHHHDHPHGGHVHSSHAGHDHHHDHSGHSHFHGHHH